MLDHSGNGSDAGLEAVPSSDRQSGVADTISQTYKEAARAARQLVKYYKDGGSTGISGVFGKAPEIFESTKAGTGIVLDGKALKEAGIGQPFTFDIVKDQGGKQGQGEQNDQGEKKQEATATEDSRLDKPHQPTRDEIIDPERYRLDEIAGQKLKDDPRALAKFKEDMEAFAIRAQEFEPKLPPEEVAKTYKEIARLIEAKGDSPTCEPERIILAQQTMHLAAFPTEVNQGDHGTCNVATVESRLYTRNPSAVVHLVAEVAIKGEYTTNPPPPDRGVTVKPNEEAIHPFGDSANQPPYGSNPAYASRIFQVTAANIAWERSNVNHPPQHIRYEQREPSAPGVRVPDSGDRLVDYSDPNNPKVLMGDGGPKHGPDISNREIVAIGTEITGQPQDGCVISRFNDGGCVQQVSSEQELNDTLAAAKRAGQLPITIFVHTGKAPLFADSDGGKAGGSGGWHVVNVTDYQDGTPPKVRMDNSWGAEADHVTDDRMVTVSSLYRAMSSPYEDLKQVQKDFEANGKHDTEIEIQLLQMEKNDGDITGAQYERRLAQAIAVSDRLWQETAKNGKPTAELQDERRRALAAIWEAMRELSPKERQRVREQVKQQLA